MTDVHKFLADLESKANAATSGPWANTSSVKEMFGIEPLDWWKVYAKNDKCCEWPILICSMSPRATDDEKLEARESSSKKGAITYDPGQAGNDADFIAAANPEAVKRLVAMTRLTIDALIHIRDKKPAWCRNACTPCRPECVARHVLDVLKNSGEK